LYIPSTLLKTIPRDQHCISRRNISAGALKVMSRLRSQDYQAYLVGGAVRDLLLGGHPKDFDIATDARPEEVAALFRNARIIGRRFRIVHVRFGPEIIEVTTFRGHHEEPDEDEEIPRDAKVSSSGRLLRDNVYGNMEEDAARRDLTINALFYDAGTFAVYDYAEGLRDLSTRTVRIIGDPEQRYREDPVRMLRVIRFAAKLDFVIAPGTGDIIPKLAPMLAEIPSARLFDEFLKLFLAGTAAATFGLLERYGLGQELFPSTARALRLDSSGRQLIEAALRGTDERVAIGKPVTPAFLLAAILWPALRKTMSTELARGESPHQALINAAQDVLNEQLAIIAIPRRFTLPMKEIWELQGRLEQRRGRKALAVLNHKRFRAAYDLLLLRAAVGDADSDHASYWTELQERHAPGTPRDDSDEPEERSVFDDDQPKRRRRPRRRRSAGAPHG
jgi:poly(A) polymerase